MILTNVDGKYFLELDIARAGERQRSGRWFSQETLDKIAIDLSEVNSFVYSKPDKTLQSVVAEVQWVTVEKGTMRAKIKIVETAAGIAYAMWLKSNAERNEKGISWGGGKFEITIGCFGYEQETMEVLYDRSAFLLLNAVK